MQIVEYKRYLVNGVLVDPEWIEVGRIMGGESLNSYIGLVLNEEDRMFYIPDSVEYKTLEEVKMIQRSKVWTKLQDESDPHSKKVDLSESEIDQMVEELLQKAGFVE